MNEVQEHSTSLVLTGATVVTVDPERRILADSAIAIEGDRIGWIGQEGALPTKFASAERLDLPGHVIYPGFVNLHTHLALSILRGIADDRGVAPAYSRKIPQGVFLQPHDCYVLSLLGAAAELRFGTTTVVDNYIYADGAARACAELGLRAVVSERIHDADLFQIPEGKYEFDRSRGDALLERGIDLIDHWQGAMGGRILVRLGPHAPDTCSSEFLGRVKEEAAKRRVGMVIHLAQSRREVQEIISRTGKTPTAFLAETGLLGPEMIAGHCIYMTPDDIALLAQTHTNVSHQSASNAKIGMMAPVRSMRKQGIEVGLGTDSMASDMIEVMRLAALVARMLDEDPLALQAEDVLEMATIGGARALGLSDEIGSIEVGKKADLVAVDYRRLHLPPVVDPVANLVHQGIGSDVTTVLVDGRLVVENGRIKTIDEQALIKEAQEIANARWDEINSRAAP